VAKKSRPPDYREVTTVVDTVARIIRSRMMSAVKGVNTKPELQVRRALHSAGFRYRLHQRDLPGRPDIAMRRFKIAIFVHGCFWHGHECPRGHRPTSNIEFWNKKLDGRNQAALTSAGWRVFIIWECSLAAGLNRIVRHLGRLRTDGEAAWK
jgi:DNA mismatch endonuclease, patch repair protein